MCFARSLRTSLLPPAPCVRSWAVVAASHTSPKLVHGFLSGVRTVLAVCKSRVFSRTCFQLQYKLLEEDGRIPCKRVTAAQIISDAFFRCLCGHTGSKEPFAQCDGPQGAIGLFTRALGCRRAWAAASFTRVTRTWGGGWPAVLICMRLVALHHLASLAPPSSSTVTLAAQGVNAAAVLRTLELRGFRGPLGLLCV